jgi:outer membrane receptor protein involved in Fe transport
MNKLFSLTIILLWMSGYAFSQNKIQAKIRDAVTGQAIQNATIISTDKKFSALSNKDGAFSISATDSISISTIGYFSKTLSIKNIKSGIYLSPAFSNLEEIIVSGSRQTQKRTEVPVAISVISGAQIDETKATRLDLLVNKVPGVFMVDLGNEQHSMSVRQPLGYGSLFLYLEDGIPIRTTGDFNHNALIEINQASVKRIEVIKGPASSLYGSEAVGGAINFITETPSPELTGKVQVEAGTRGYKRTDFRISNTHKKSGYFFGGYYADQQQNKNEHNNFDKVALTFRGDYALDSKSNLTAVVDFIRYNTDQKGGLDSAHFYDKNYSSFYRFTYRKVNAFRARTTLNKEWNTQNNTSFTLFYRNTSIGQNPFYSIVDIAGTDHAKGQINKDAFNSFGSVIQHTKNIKTLATKWITGLSVDYSPAIYIANFITIKKDAGGAYDQFQKTDSVLTDYHVNLMNSALYTQLEWNQTSPLRIVAAARYDRLDYHFDNHLIPGAFTGAPDAKDHFAQFTPKLGLTYDFGKNKGIYLNYSIGFAPPNITDLYSGVQVPTLKPSNYKNYEIGGWLAFAENKISAEASVYLLNGINEIVNIRQADGSYQKENVGKTSHKGFELNVKYQPISEVTFRIGGTVARHRYINYSVSGKSLSGNDMGQSPAFIANGELTYKPACLKNFRITVECQSMGRYFTDPQNTQTYDGFTVFNARMGYEFKRFETWVNAINFTNKNYAVTVEKSVYGTSYRPGQLSTINIGFAYHFGKI